MLLEGTVVNGAIVLDGNEQLPEGVRVEVAVKKKGLGLPEDLAARHDYYLTKARCVDGSSVELTFADGLVACLSQSQLGLAIGEVDLRTAESTVNGLAIKPTKGGRFVIDWETLRYVADPAYAAKMDHVIRDLHISPAEANEAARLSKLTRDPRWNDVGDEDDLFE